MGKNIVPGYHDPSKLSPFSTPSSSTTKAPLVLDSSATEPKPAGSPASGLPRTSTSASSKQRTSLTRLSSDISLTSPSTQPVLCKPAWEVYARELGKLGHGRPLWHPEPTAAGGVEIGDVGYLDHGRFVRLFNVIASVSAPVNLGVLPEGYPLFEVEDGTETSSSSPSNVWQSRHISRSGSPLVSRHPSSPSKSSSESSASSSSSPSPPPSSSSSSSSPTSPSKDLQTSSTYSFISRGQDAAILIAMDTVNSREILPNPKLTQYIQHTHALWPRIAQSKLGLVLRDEDLVFIRGHVKTSNRWVALSTTGSGRITVEADKDDVHTIMREIKDLTVSVRHGLGPIAVAAGEIRKLQERAGIIEPASEEELRNHCLFVKLYRVKRRIFFPIMKIVANAEPRDDEPQEGEGGEASIPVEYQNHVDDGWIMMPLLLHGRPATTSVRRNCRTDILTSTSTDQAMQIVPAISLAY